MNIWFIIGSVSAIIPILLIKEYTVNKNVLYLILSMMCYLVLIKSYLNIFNTNQVSTSYTFIQLLQILLVLLSGIVLFKEKINLQIIIGIILACIAMYLLK
jgi:multidrug transporter EmrE-like cation transporter